MSRNYILKITKKNDSSILMECYINCVKNFNDVSYMFDYMRNNVIHCCKHCLQNFKFTFDDVQECATAIEQRIKNNLNKITQLEFQKCCCVNTDVKYDFEQEIRDMNEEINDLFFAHSSASQIMGIINCVCDKTDSTEYIDTSRDIELEITVS